MTFFNPKEDVLDIELTQYGKWALSQGKLNPSYYLFFDDDVLYDVSCASVGIGESQNDAHKRIIENTPRLKTQYSFRESSPDIISDSAQKTSEKHFLLENALGTSDMLTEKYPRWDIKMFGDDGPKITSAVEYLTSSFGTVRVPQIEVSANFRTAVHSVSGEKVIKEDINLSSPTQADGTYIAVQPRTILMQVLENNSPFEKENFDIEVYIKDTENSVDDWKQLSFKKKVTNIVDGMLVDEEPEICHNLDSSYVEYYFDIFVDDEIGEAANAQISEDLKTQSLYLSDASSATTSGEFTMADIYSQVVPDDPCPDDKCP